MSKDLLIEIGVEELPSSYMDELFELLSSSFSSFLSESYIKRNKEEVFLTPRRIIFIAKEVADRQEIPENEIKGPPKTVALSEDGKPTQALIKFLERCNSERWCIKSTPQGEYVFSSLKQKNLETKEIIERDFPHFLLSLPYSKKMIWEGFTFIRPIRWIVSLLGEELLNLNICGVKSGRISKGLRGYPEIFIENASNYEALMEKNRIIISRSKRMEMIREKLTHYKENILNENVNRSEYPICVNGKFDEEFLALPNPIISAVLAGSLKCFPLEDENKNLRNEFIFVMDGPRDEEIVKRGYEKVVTARLKDAAYFLKVDRKKELSERIRELSNIVFIGSLGTIAQKIERMKMLAPIFSGIVDNEKLNIAIELSKADLTTKVVYEFPELQGIMGKIYALNEGIDEEIANSLYEHYLPVYEGDPIPKDNLSRILSIIDKTDSFIGILSEVIEVTGSYDPFGLRRTVSGLIRIFLSTYIPIKLNDLFNSSIKAYNKINSLEFNEGFFKKVVSFLSQRLKNILGAFLKYDTVNAIINEDLENPYILKMKGEIIEEERKGFSFKILCESHTRINNILKGAEFKEDFKEELLKEKCEIELYKAYLEVRDAYIQEKDFKEKIKILYRLNEPITAFFDNVLVITQDLDIRNNRLSLLKQIRELFCNFADFQKIVI